MTGGRVRGVIFAWLLAAVLPSILATSRAAVEITVTATPGGRVLSPLIFGSNLQWADRGDGVLSPDGRTFVPAMLQRARELAPSVLRYPGGSDSDVYHWRAGWGAERSELERFGSRQKSRVEFGSQEFLELCEALGAEPLITTNVVTGTASEAVEWLRAVNQANLKSRTSGKALPKVRHWEIGNEPYLRDDKRKALWLTPGNFATRAKAIIAALRAADPNLLLGLPLRSDRIGGQYATPSQGYNDVVLKALASEVDFVAVHDAYLPYAVDRSYDDDALYRATMAAPDVTAADLAATVEATRAAAPGRPLRVAVTEYSAFFSIGQRSDAYILGGASALYVADLLRVFAANEAVWMANHWSLAGNWHFGAFDTSSSPRPTFHALKLVRPLAGGTLTPVSIRAPVFSTPTVGFVPAREDVPLVTGLATLTGNTLRLVLINKDRTSSQPAVIRIASDGKPISASGATYAPRKAFEPGNEQVQMLGTTIAGDSIRLELPAMSVSRVDIELQGRKK